MSKLLLLGLSLFQVIRVTIQQDVIHLSGPSGEFTSPGYPNTQPLLVSWNITVDEDRRIILQLIDFELVETDTCHLDIFELYDGAFNEDLQIGRWCWDSFDKLNPTTYISSGNVFILQFRAIEGRSRKGFKANYSSIPREATTTTSSNVLHTTALNGLTTPTKNVPKEATPATFSNVLQTTTRNEPTTPTQNVTTGTAVNASSTSRLGRTESSQAKGTSNVAVMTSPTSGSDGARISPGAFVVILAGVIAIIISVVILVLWKYKMNNQAKKASPDEHSESSSRAKANIEMYEEIKKETNDEIKGSYENTNQTGDGEKFTPAIDSSLIVQQSGVYSKEIIRQGNMDTPDGTYEKPDVNVYSYADPNELKLCVK